MLDLRVPPPMMHSMLTPQAVRILLVDDHPLVRDGLKARLSSQVGWAVCGEAETATEAVRLVRELAPQLAIIDLSLKSGSGLELIKQIAAMAAPPRMLVCSMHDDNLYAHRAIQAGALGYLNKQRASEQLVEAAERVLSGKLFVSAEVTEQTLQRMLQGHNKENPMEQLTDRELQVFEAIGRGMTVNQIAESLFLSTKTVETYRERTKRKLQLKSSSELMRYAVKWVTEQTGG